MASLSIAYISGTTLAHFVAAAYSCTSCRKYVFKLHGFFQSACEMTDYDAMKETRSVVLLGAAPMDSSDTPIGMQNVGYLTICLSPSHKLSYADMERLQKKAEPRCAMSQVLMHMTYEIKGNCIERVIYSVYEIGVQPLTLLQLKVDNLVDIMDGFTKLSNVFERNVSLTGASPVSVDEEKQVDTVNLQSARQQELEVLAREKASLTKCILELNRKL